VTTTSQPGTVSLPGTPSGWGRDGADPAGVRAQCAADRSLAVERVIAAMHERLDAPFELKEMARIAYLSPYYFNRVFRQLTGVPPRRFHMALRMAEAKRLLLTTDLSVTEICLDLGYQSLGTFTTHFHELVGVSPRGLRRLAATPPCTPDDLVAALERQAENGVAPLLAGAVTVPDGAEDCLVFIGLFATPSPEGLPSGCTARLGPGAFHLRAPAGARRHLAAAAFPRSDDPCTYLAPDERDFLVGLSPFPIDSAGRALELRLRRVRPTDPPVLLALPVLLARRLAERDALQVA
jgi:AraC-like DNA-binding protein